jgi:hypothetical protein
MSTTWQYPPFQPLLIPPIHYEIRIGVSAQGSDSCCIFEIFDPASVSAVHQSDPLFSGSADSTHWRACYAAIAGGLECLPQGASALIVCSQVEAMKVVERIDRLALGGWLTAEGKPIAHVDILQRIKLARDGKNETEVPRLKTVSCNFEPSLEQQIAISRLQKLAAAALRIKRNR